MGKFRTEEVRTKPIEDKSTNESHKIWELESSKPVIQINSDGTITPEILKQVKKNLPQNQFVITNYEPSSTQRRVLIRLGEEIYKIDAIGVNETDASLDAIIAAISDIEGDIVIIQGDISTIETALLALTTGAASSTDNAIAKFDGTTGKIIKNSGVTIDSNNIVLTPGAFKVGTSTSFVSSDGAKFYKQSDHGTCIQAVTGSINNICFFTAGGVILMSNPTGTNRLVSGVTGIVDYYLGYSSMTANNPTFFVYGWRSVATTGAKFGSLQVDTNGDFKILAQSSQNLLLGANAAAIMHLTSGQVGIGGLPNANAVLDCQSTTKPFMPPRMTTTQRDNVASPTAGMVIYNTTTNKLNVYTTAWEAVTSA